MDWLLEVILWIIELALIAGIFALELERRLEK